MTTTKHNVALSNADDLFPSDEDGRNTYASEEAVKLARELLKAPEGAEITWDLPDVFSIAYGSTYIGTATYQDRTVEFHFED